MSRRSQTLRFLKKPITNGTAPRLGQPMDVKHYTHCRHCAETWQPADCPLVHDSPCPELVCRQVWVA